jgi:hypothetical protein
VEHCSIPKSSDIARVNWEDWREVFEHDTPIQTNPLLAHQKRFSDFCQEYYVGRTIRRGKRNELRIELLEPPFLNAIRDIRGALLTG